MNHVSSMPNRTLSLAAWAILILAVGSVAWSWQSGGIAWTILRTDLNSANKLEEIRLFFGSFGAWAPLVYVVCVTIEVVVAPLPGLMLYAPGGVVFGGFQGGVLSLTGNTLGAGVCCAAVRGVGDAWMRRFFSAEKLDATQATLERRGAWLILLLRANPLTSSDLVSYAAGLTRIPVWQVMLATAVGMAPLCFAQAYLADNLMRRFPGLLYPLIALCAVYVIIVLRILFGMRKTTTTKAEVAPRNP